MVVVQVTENQQNIGNQRPTLTVTGTLQRLQPILSEIIIYKSSAKRQKHGDMKIEKGIPLPKAIIKGSTKILKDMNIGDSFISTNSTKWHCLARQSGMSVATRKQPDGQYRIWRTA